MRGLYSQSTLTINPIRGAVKRRKAYVSTTDGPLRLKPHKNLQLWLVGTKLNGHCYRLFFCFCFFSGFFKTKKKKKMLNQLSFSKIFPEIKHSNSWNWMQKSTYYSFTYTSWHRIHPLGRHLPHRHWQSFVMTVPLWHRTKERSNALIPGCIENIGERTSASYLFVLVFCT